MGGDGHMIMYVRCVVFTREPEKQIITCGSRSIFVYFGPYLNEYRILFQGPVVGLFLDLLILLTDLCSHPLDFALVLL